MLSPESSLHITGCSCLQDSCTQANGFVSSWQLLVKHFTPVPGSKRKALHTQTQLAAPSQHPEQRSSPLRYAVADCETHLHAQNATCALWIVAPVPSNQALQCRVHQLELIHLAQALHCRGCGCSHSLVERVFSVAKGLRLVPLPRRQAPWYTIRDARLPWHVPQPGGMGL